MSLARDIREIWRLGGLSKKEFIIRLYRRVFYGDVWGYAAQLAYYFFFALFPFFIFLTALLAYIPIPDLMDHIMVFVHDLVPEESAVIIQDNVRELVTRPRGGLLSFGILFALWLASSAMVAVGDCLNRAYGVRESRPYWKVRLLGVVLTIGLAVLVISSMTLLIFGPELGAWLVERFDIGPALDLFWHVVRWPIAIFLMMLTIALVYYFTPDVEQEWRWITPGSVIAVLAWVGTSLAFAFYVDNFGQYDKTYGSIGAIIVLLMWMYFSGFFLLLGGEINAEIEQAALTGKNEGDKRMPGEREIERRRKRRFRRPRIRA